MIKLKKIRAVPLANDEAFSDGPSFDYVVSFKSALKLDNSDKLPLEELLRGVALAMVAKTLQFNPNNKECVFFEVSYTRSGYRGPVCRYAFLHKGKV